jgi:hypothetical protein
MENYPTIQRRDGTLFFACPEFDKGAIATSIERLIDMLDAMEDDPDLEPYLAGYAGEGGDDRETDLDVLEGDDNPDDEDGADDEPSIGTSYYAGYGHFELDLELDTADSEPAFGWTDKLDQSTPIAHALASNYEDEPELGWSGNGKGWSEGDGVDDREGDDERDWDAGCPSGGDHGIADRDAIASDEWTFGASSGDGSGNRIATNLIRGLPVAARRAAIYSIVGARP